MRYCEYCGSERSDTAKFCPKCGKAIVDISNTPNQHICPKGTHQVENDQVELGTLKLQITVAESQLPYPAIRNEARRIFAKKLLIGSLSSVVIVAIVYVAFFATGTVNAPGKPLTVQQATVPVQQSFEVKGTSQLNQTANNKLIRLSQDEWNQLNTFFSNFSETFLEPFDSNGPTDEALIIFGIRHNYRNRSYALVSGGVPEKQVDYATLKYFGKKVPVHHSAGAYQYKNGVYYKPQASGESICFSQVVQLEEMGNSIFKAEINIFQASSGFAGNPNGNDDTWSKEVEYPPKVIAKMIGVIRKINDNSGARYILTEYKK